jgi:hypothetical protein
VAQLQTEKQQILQRCSALELENANLQVWCTARPLLCKPLLALDWSVPVPPFTGGPQELVGFLSEAAELSPTDGSLEVCEQDLEEIYTVIVDDDQQPPGSPEAAGGNRVQPALSTPQ